MAALVDGCAICNGRGQVAAGASCPVCEGTGVVSAEEAAKYRQLLVDAAVEAATERFRQAGAEAGAGVLRKLAQAHDDTKETTARAGQVLEALSAARQAAWVAQQAAQRVMGAETVVTRAEAAASRVATVLAAPDPTDPPPGIVLPAGMGGEIFYMDSLLVRQLDVWGNLNVGGSGGLLTNPMTTLGDLIEGGALGAPARLAVGANGQVLTVVGGVPAWANSAAGFANPMTTPQDLIVGGTAGAAGRLGVGANGQVLTVTAGAVGWANSPAGFANPMTTQGDLIVAGAVGAAGRLAIGTSGKVLTSNGTTAIWQTNPVGFTNPMTTAGDLIVATAGGAAARLPVGANQQVLTVAGGVPAWAASPSTLGTPLAGPAGNPTVWGQADGSVLVLPLSFWGLSGDDSVWINNAFTQLPTIAGGSSQYGVTYNGPWIMGTVRLGPYDYIIQTGITVPVNKGLPVNIFGSGQATRLLVQSGGAVTGISRHCAVGGPQNNLPAMQIAGTIRDLRIDGIGAAAGSVGLEIGGGWGHKVLDVAIVNFYGANSIGLHLNNAPNAVAGEWTEKMRCRVDLIHNQIPVMIENTSSNTNSDSFEYNDLDFYIMQDLGQGGIVMQGGAYINGGSMRVRGNFANSSGPVLTLQGSDGSGTFSHIAKSFVDIVVEHSNTVNLPQTIFFGTTGGAGNGLNNCVGVLSFQFGTTNWTPTNGTAGNFSFGGNIDGDATLQALATAAAGRASAAAPNGWV